MITTIHLTEREQRLYQMLPETLRAGWAVETEALRAEESASELAMRYQIASLSDPAVRALLDAAQDAKTPDDFSTIAATFDVHALSQEQLAELCFAMGSRMLSLFIQFLLGAAQDDEDIEGIAALSLIRQYLLQSSADIS